ncbi:hypothetical protein [Olivibacter sitiensis]|nr:hypothetical protein [Olivibacter sitiensis]
MKHDLSQSNTGDKSYLATVLPRLGVRNAIFPAVHMVVVPPDCVPT